MASASVALAVRNDICIGNPTGKKIFSSDWYNKQISWMPAEGGFVVHLDELPLNASSITVRVKTKEDPTGLDKYENETWEDCTINLRLCSAFAPHQMKRNWTQASKELDATQLIAETLAGKYQIVFNKYVTHFAEAHARSRLSSGSNQLSAPPAPFAAFYNADMPVADASFKIELADPDDSKDASTGPITGEPDEVPAEVAITVPVHQFVLIGASQKFKDSLVSSTSIRVHGIGIETLTKFAKYLYTRQVEFSSDKEAGDLYALALRFDIEHLKLLAQPRAQMHLMSTIAPNSMVLPEALSKQLRDLESIAEIDQLYRAAADQISHGYSVLLANPS